MDNPMPTGPSALRTSIRLSLQYSFLYSVLSAFVFALAYWFTQYEVQDWVLDQMRSDAGTLAKTFEASGKEALFERVDALAEVSFENARVYQLLNVDGVIMSGNLASTLEIPLPDFVPAEELPLAGDIHDEVSGYWLRVDEIGPYLLIQGTGDHLVLEILEALGIALVVGYLAVVTIGLIAGVWIGRITERRIAAISNTLSEVSSGNLASRIPISSNPRDDLSRLSAEINSMLGQITRLLESQEQISNDIAHDMRTPLQHLRQRLEKLRDSQAIRPDDISTSLEQTEEIISTFNALLRIAQIEGSDRRERFAWVDLCGVIVNVTEVFEPAAEDAGIRLTSKVPDEQLEVFGDSNLITQLLSNLVENAIKHCPEGTMVSVSGDMSLANPTLRISDNGPGIECADRERIFRRFFRGEKSRNSPGNGLGLALVKAICDLHGAEMIVSDNCPGAVFEIRFLQ
ncbi:MULTISPECIES: ATP-binding protein [unclassified Sulfitobacter]|uniref:sensor histidine kinase n=1 Tax=unclassified Sulfitobacter TaxID=196795 RepID=UPI0023E16902|nr:MULTISPECIES: ATP-binding protein [unclassified Sulfitobacter]MDF3382575.1 sensor histidine kinase [Sulfitobacter sp. Ks11]MDF3385994.1 sensor histidine kinase [Sulfitobacter sp. M85]MDF3389413.1 sensor histidine kinase [Sulfitobacter sp. Ks16]MDF3400050.1 sensor histidine kinase [Sulfitobacter sp. KE39]MDF3403471.1 sensor histidine kinase [Sulfitobacter sp. Ks35]